MASEGVLIWESQGFQELEASKVPFSGNFFWFEAFEPRESLKHFQMQRIRLSKRFVLRVWWIIGSDASPRKLKRIFFKYSSKSFRLNFKLKVNSKEVAAQWKSRLFKVIKVFGSGLGHLNQLISDN